MNKILIGSLAFVGFYNLLFYPTELGIGLGLLFGFLHIYLYFVRANPTKNLSLAVSLSILSVFFATSTGWRSIEIVQALDFLLALALTVFAAYFYKKEEEFSWGIFSFLLSPLFAGIAGLQSIYNFFTHNSLATHTKSNQPVYSAIFRGVLIAIPILFVLYKLLAGADPIFAKLLGNISLSLSWQLVVSLFLFTVTFFWGIATVKDRIVIKDVITGNQSVAIEALVVTLSAAFLFAIFLYVQIQYLFLQVPETQLQHLGINVKTYSEYVRQGFFQLLVASAIASAIIAYGLQTVHTILEKRQLYLKLGMVLLSLETEFLLISAAKRLYLYTDAHGLTRSRVFGTVFLIWLAVMLVLMLWATAKNMKRMYFFLGALTITILAFVSINVVSIDSLVANYYPPTVNKEIDYVYISRLSPDAVSSWPALIQNAENQWQILSKANIPNADQSKRIEDLRYSLVLVEDKVNKLKKNYSKDSKWQEFNVSDYQAYLFVQQNKSLFDKLKSLQDAIAQRKQVWYEVQSKNSNSPRKL